MTVSVLRAGHTLAIEDVYHTPYLSAWIAVPFPDRSLLGLPLIAAERKLRSPDAHSETHAYTAGNRARRTGCSSDCPGGGQSVPVSRTTSVCRTVGIAVRARTCRIASTVRAIDAILRSVDDAISCH